MKIFMIKREQRIPILRLIKKDRAGNKYITVDIQLNNLKFWITLYNVMYVSGINLTHSHII